MDPPAPADDAADARLLAALRAWGEDGPPFAAARIAPRAGLEAVACELDGSHALARLGPWRGRAWRLRLLLAPAAGDPWDCGWWRGPALEAATAFRPRRTTLLMVREAQAPFIEPLRATLAAHAAGFARPLRLLLASDRPCQGLATFTG